MSAARGIRPLHAALAAVGSTLVHPLARWAGLGLLLALLGVAVLGPTPGSVARELPPAADWQLPAADRPAAAGIAARRASAPLWASQPEREVAAGPTAEPPPRLVGIVATSSGARIGVFESVDGRRQRAGLGDSLAGMGEIVAVSATAVRWRDAKGDLMESRLFLDTQPRPVPEVPADTP